MFQVKLELAKLNHNISTLLSTFSTSSFEFFLNPFSYQLGKNVLQITSKALYSGLWTEQKKSWCTILVYLFTFFPPFQLFLLLAYKRMNSKTYVNFIACSSIIKAIKVFGFSFVRWHLNRWVKYVCVRWNNAIKSFWGHQKLNEKQWRNFHAIRRRMRPSFQSLFFEREFFEVSYRGFSKLESPCVSAWVYFYGISSKNYSVYHSSSSFWPH